jgi:hypothetical protein
MAKSKPKTDTDHAQALQERLAIDEPSVMITLFIPSHDRKQKELNNQLIWADAGLELFSELFGGATAFETYRGIYRDTDQDVDLTDKPILLQSYAKSEVASDEYRLTRLCEFMRRMGRETKQAAVAVAIKNVFHEIRDF